MPWEPKGNDRESPRKPMDRTGVAFTPTSPQMRALAALPQENGDDDEPYMPEEARHEILANNDPTHSHKHGIDLSPEFDYDGTDSEDNGPDEQYNHRRGQLLERGPSRASHLLPLIPRCVAFLLQPTSPTCLATSLPATRHSIIRHSITCHSVTRSLIRSFFISNNTILRIRVVGVVVVFVVFIPLAIPSLPLPARATSLHGKSRNTSTNARTHRCAR